MEKLLIIVFWKAIEVVNQRLVHCSVDLDQAWAIRLPVCGEDDDGLWFHLGHDLAAEEGEARIRWMRDVVHDARPAVGEEVDRRSS